MFEPHSLELVSRVLTQIRGEGGEFAPSLPQFEARLKSLSSPPRRNFDESSDDYAKRYEERMNELGLVKVHVGLANGRRGYVWERKEHAFRGDRF